MNDEIQIDSTTSTAEEIEKNLEAQGYEIVRDDAQAAPAEQTEENNEATESTEKTESTEATEAAETTDSDEHTEAQTPKKKGFQKRIDKLTKEKRELEARLSALEQKFQQGNQQSTQPAAKSNAKPVSENFNSYDEFLEALADWKVDERERQREAQRAQQEQQAKAQEQQKSFGQRVEAAREKHEDFDEVAGRDDVIIPPAAAQAIVEATDGAEIMYHLGKHPEIAEKLQGLSPYQQVLEIGRISQSFAQPTPKKAAPVSKAPAPVKTVAGKASKTTLTPGEMDIDTYRAWYESGGAM